MNKLQQLESLLNQVILGKKDQVRLTIVCLLAGGHLLLEDLPGTGKTTLAKALSRLLNLDTKRVQFTADMLPADITGSMIYNGVDQTSRLQKGPIFSNILLADEINRASPKCQSALLEAMEETQVSIDGKTIKLPYPFFVIATQNPTEQYGTFPLPESQLDRFLLKLSIGYMQEEPEIAVLLGEKRQETIKQLNPILSQEELLTYQVASQKITVSQTIASYVQKLLQHTRESGLFQTGLSTRSGLAIIDAAKAYAYILGEPAVYPEHIQHVFTPVASHRLIIRSNSHESKDEIIKKAMFDISLPI